MPIDKSNFPAIRSDVSITHHPNTIASKWVALDEDGTAGQAALNAAVAASKLVYVGQTEANDARKAVMQHIPGRPAQANNPRSVAIKHGFEREYADGVNRIRERVLKSFDAYHRQIAGTCDQLAEKIKNALKDKTTPPHVQAEVRAHVKSLPDRDRFTFVDQQDLPTFAAVASAPAFLSGLSDHQLALLQERAEARFAAADAAHNRAVNEVYVHLVQVREAFVKWADGEIAEANTPAAKAAAKMKALGK